MAKLNKLSVIINSHENNGKGWGNGGHGHCKHCGLALVTDLGYCSWEGTKCIDRYPKDISEMPEEIKSFANFNGLKYNSDKKIFSKAYSDTKYTINQLIKKVNELKSIIK